MLNLEVAEVEVVLVEDEVLALVAADAAVKDDETDAWRGRWDRGEGKAGW